MSQTSLCVLLNEKVKTWTTHSDVRTHTYTHTHINRPTRAHNYTPYICTQPALTFWDEDTSRQNTTEPDRETKNHFVSQISGAVTGRADTVEETQDTASDTEQWRCELYKGNAILSRKKTKTKLAHSHPRIAGFKASLKREKQSERSGDGGARPRSGMFPRLRNMIIFKKQFPACTLVDAVQCFKRKQPIKT